MPPTNDSLAAGSTSDAGVLLDPLRVRGVDPADPAGTLPDDAKQNGIVCIIPRWPAFPTDARIDHVDIFIVGNPVPIAQRDYGVADDAAEFPIPIEPTLLPDLPTFEIEYTVRSVNNTTSPRRRLTFAIVAPPQVLKEATFPDASLWGYINCTKNNPQDPDSLYVWEGIRILIPFDNRFELWDVIELVWQGWDSLNGAGTALTPVVTITGTVTDVTNKQPVSIVIRPFVPHIEPMRDNDSATVSYLLLRNGVPIFRSFTGLVKIDRVIPGNSGFCSDASWMK
ncbi:hypothetical protein PS943_01542 [Pseudomonas fluorescens]|uniref:Uncharacterized protein n=1 Tax=Pseudomonas fluorescens TaxID=294 RepID=A0A5E7W4I2_PSEFL|nr:hypothetical protein [Pseudomonas fluorescens]VVQ29813.1 hypothetical protein PS943_01542 [Pseudomonas fluorescens]